MSEHFVRWTMYKPFFDFAHTLNLCDDVERGLYTTITLLVFMSHKRYIINAKVGPFQEQELPIAIFIER